MMTFWGMFLLAYVAGSINFAVLFLKLAGKRDPRESFSGNAGVTNVYRSAGQRWAALILLFDVGRGILLAWISLRFLGASQIPWIAFALILGNSYPCFHGFRGGKGVAAFLGFLFLLAPWIALFAALLWVVIFRFVRIPFVASFGMIFSLVLGMIIRCGWRTSALFATLAIVTLIVFNHRKNISALIKGSGK